MSKVSRDTSEQIAAARKAMDKYRVALKALATAPPDPSTEEGKEFQRQMEIARERMEKYRTVYRDLAK